MVWSNRIRVIFADDGALMRRLFRETFEVNPRLEIVGFATNAQEVTNLFRARSPHLILVDECLLGVSGSEIIRQIRSRDRDVAIVGVVSPTRKGRDEGTEMIIQGANSFVEKPLITGHPSDAIRAFEEAVLPELIAWGEQVKFNPMGPSRFEKPSAAEH